MGAEAVPSGRAGCAVHGVELDRRGHWLRSALTSGPSVLWLTMFLLLPLLGIGVISFLSRGDYGEIQTPFTLDNYRRLLGFGWLGFDPLYPGIFLRSLALGGGTAALCLLTGLPLAFFIGRQSAGLKTVALALVVVPFWTNLLIRTYAWQIILSPGGWVAQALGWAGLAGPGGLYPGTGAVMIGMVCDFLPFMVLPLYVSVEKIDWSLAEAAMDLGAAGWQVFRHALWPQIKPGLFAGSVLVFLPATGQFVIPDLLGGARTVMLGNAVQQQFGPSRDWPFGAAIAFVALGLVLTGLWLLARKGGEKEVEFL